MLPSTKKHSFYLLSSPSVCRLTLPAWFEFAFFCFSLLPFLTVVSSSCCRNRWLPQRIHRYPTRLVDGLGYQVMKSLLAPDAALSFTIKATPQNDKKTMVVFQSQSVFSSRRHYNWHKCFVCPQGQPRNASAFSQTRTTGYIVVQIMNEAPEICKAQAKQQLI